ncbi:MAG: hypothetical protein FJZ87_17045 [Chloroflexi bacterium]|nr:hypothetical protein [Chloroflexota bacterium]
MNVNVGGGKVEEGVGMGVSVRMLVAEGAVSDGPVMTVGEEEVEQAVVRTTYRMIHGILLK